MDNNNKPVEGNGGRRNALRLLLGGGVVGTAAALPTRWTKPVVEAVILPAHAQLSGLHSYVGQGSLTASSTGSVDPSRLLDLVVPQAVAGASITGQPYDVCIVITDGTADVRINLPSGCSLHGSGAVGGASIALTDFCAGTCGFNSPTPYCTVFLYPDQTKVEGVLNLGILDVDVFSGGYIADLQAGICSLPQFAC